MVTRLIRNERKAKRFGLLGWAHGVHTKSLYKRLAGAVDGNLDVRVIERDDGVKNLLLCQELEGATA